jgi:hypothetical protein
MICNKDDINYKTIISSINNIFLNVDKDISKDILKKYNIITRKSKLSFKDVLLYSLQYTYNNKTKIDIINIFNKDKEENEKISRTTFYEKETKISFSYYSDIYHKLILIIKKYFNDNKNSIIAVDGTYTNTNIKNIKDYLETSLNMGFFDVTYDIPIELIFKGEESKNKEIDALQKYITANKNQLKNVIFVLDRAYCSYKFIDFCYLNKIKYVIRFRNNCINIPKKNRIIKFDHSIYETVKNNDIDKQLIDNKKFSCVSLKTKNEYTLITNLDLINFNDNKIKEIYNSRWNVEVFFKIIKYNFKFSDMKITNEEHNNEIYSIHNIKILIVMLLAKIMEKTHQYEEKIKLTDNIKKRNFKSSKKSKSEIIVNNKKNTPSINDNSNEIINVNSINNKKIILEDKTNIISTTKTKTKTETETKTETKTERKCILKPNITNIIKGIYELMQEIVNGKLTTESYSNVAKQYIKYYKIDKSINNKRTCKTPFKKWYVKGYTNKSDSIKIVNSILGFTESELNKNLMIKLKNSVIVKINYINT